MTAMKRLLRLIVILLAFVIGAPITDGFAQKKSVHVKEYTKKDGTTGKGPRPEGAGETHRHSNQSHAGETKKESTIKAPAVDRKGLARTHGTVPSPGCDADTNQRLHAANTTVGAALAQLTTKNVPEEVMRRRAELVLAACAGRHA